MRRLKLNSICVLENKAYRDNTMILSSDLFEKLIDLYGADGKEF